MTTISQVRQVLQPVLARNPDLELMGRSLFIKPVHHMMKGIFIDRSSDRNEFIPASRVNLMLLNQGRYLISRGERLCKIYIDRQDLAKLQIALPLAETTDRNEGDNPYPSVKR